MAQSPTHRADPARAPKAKPRRAHVADGASPRSSRGRESLPRALAGTRNEVHTGPRRVASRPEGGCASVRRCVGTESDRGWDGAPGAARGRALMQHGRGSSGRAARSRRRRVSGRSGARGRGASSPPYSCESSCRASSQTSCGCAGCADGRPHSTACGSGAAPSRSCATGAWRTPRQAPVRARRARARTRNAAGGGRAGRAALTARPARPQSRRAPPPSWRG
jgi:hypothetical protein